MKNYRKNLSIRWNLFSIFMVFLVLFLSIVWVFQIGFLDDFYKYIKKRSIESTAQQVIANYQDYQGLSSLERYATENEFHIRIVSNQGILISESVGVPSVWIQDILASQYQNIYRAAYENGGNVYINFEGVYNQNEYITYVAIVDGSTMVVIQSLIVPVDATVSTLKIQLWIITGILAVIALGFSWFESRRLSSPLIQLNNEAKGLGTIRDERPFEANGYKEVNELSETLNDAHKALFEVEAMRKELLANVSHDLKTPLTMIQGYGELIRDIPGETTQDNAQIIIDEAKHLARLVDDLLDLSKLHDGMDRLNLETLKIHDIIDPIIKRYQFKTIQCDIDENWEVEADPVKVHQVLYNLINNAYQHGGEDVEVLIRCRKQKDTIRIEVIDNGPGMSKEDIKNIWDRYVRTQTDHTREKIGSGIGLSIVRHVLQLHDMPFGVESEIGKGSTFWFELKLKGIV